MIRSAALAGMGLVLVSALSGCMPGIYSRSCVSWAGYETPQDQYDSAGLVVVGQVIELDGVKEAPPGAPTGDTRIYRIRVDEVHKGEAGDVVHVGSTSDGCPDTHYAEGDQLDTQQRIVVFARNDDGAWTTLTPFDGVIELSQDGELPFEPTSRE